MSTPDSPRRAFTLLESVLVVLLIGLVTSLLLPTLSAARERARDTASLANLRTHSQVLAAYAADWDDYYPAFADPDATYSIVRGCGRSHTFRYFESVAFWTFALCEGYYDRTPEHASLIHPGQRGEGILHTNYLLSSAFYAAPSYWNESTRLSGTRQWGPSRLSSVVFNSSKAVAVEIHPTRGFPHRAVRSGVGLAFADSSAGRFAGPELQQPYPHGDAWIPVGIFGMHTIDGWAGRDR